tara:strand:+ start:38 stop:643 length:606 start_codon:yes stop_codon:yes gene_type:complete
MPITFNGNGTITGIAAGGLPDGCVQLADLATTGTASSSTFLRGDAAFAAAGGGKLLQVVTADTSTQTSNSAYTPATTGLTASITPSATSSKILVATSSNINILGDGTSSSGRQIYLWLSRGGIHNTGTTLQAIRIGISAGGSYTTAPENNEQASFSYLDSPNTTSATSYHVSFGKYDNNCVMYAQKGGAYKSTIVLMEIEG